MTITYYAGRLMHGTSADRTGGTWTNLPTGWRFFETDNLLMYYWNASTWQLQTEKAVTETLTNKTLTAPIISTISNTGTVTIPTGTDTLANLAGSQTQTNKTMDAKSNTFSNIHVHPSMKRTGSYSGAGNAAVVCSGMLQGTGTTIAVTGGAFSGIVRTSGMRGRYVTTTTTGSMAGTRFNSTLLTQRSLNPLLEMKLGFPTTPLTSERRFIGYTSAATAPTSLADPLANLSGVGFWLDTAIDSNWHIIQNSGTATSDWTTIANVAAGDFVAHTFFLKAVTDTKWQYSYDGGAYADITTLIPASTTGLGPMWYIENTSAGAKTIDCYWMWMECDP